MCNRILLGISICLMVSSVKTNAQTLAKHTPVQIDSILSLRFSKNGKLDTIHGGYDGRYTFYRKFLLIKTHTEKGFWSNLSILFDKRLLYHEDNYSSTNLETPKHTVHKFYYLDSEPVKYEDITFNGTYDHPIPKTTTIVYLDHGSIIQVKKNPGSNKALTAKQMQLYLTYINSELPRLKADNPFVILN